MEHKELIETIEKQNKKIDQLENRIKKLSLSVDLNEILLEEVRNLFNLDTPIGLRNARNLAKKNGLHLRTINRGYITYYMLYKENNSLTVLYETNDYIRLITTLKTWNKDIENRYIDNCYYDLNEEVKEVNQKRINYEIQQAQEIKERINLYPWIKKRDKWRD